MTSKSETKNSKIGLLEFDKTQLTSEFLKSRFWTLYLHSSSFTESVRLFLQTNYKVNLTLKEQEEVRQIFMSEVAKAFESES